MALEGQFSAEGLAALSADSGSLTMELAKSLVENLDFGDAERVWAKLNMDEAVAVQAVPTIEARVRLFAMPVVVPVVACPPVPSVPPLHGSFRCFSTVEQRPLRRRMCKDRLQLVEAMIVPVLPCE